APVVVGVVLRRVPDRGASQLVAGPSGLQAARGVVVGASPAGVGGDVADRGEVAGDVVLVGLGVVAHRLRVVRVGTGERPIAPAARRHAEIEGRLGDVLAAGGRGEP